jgi:hypothetical protein
MEGNIPVSNVTLLASSGSPRIERGSPRIERGSPRIELGSSRIERGVLGRVCSFFWRFDRNIAKE